MDLDKTLRILRQAKWDPSRISLACVDLLLVQRPESEREKLRRALQVASVPHWFDEEILEVLLDAPLAAEAQSLTSQLRRLSVVEPFPARGPGAANVHEAARLALRDRMKMEFPDQLAVLSARARAYFQGEAAHLRIEALYHQFVTQPEDAKRGYDLLLGQGNDSAQHEEFLALKVVLRELKTTKVVFIDHDLPDRELATEVVHILEGVGADCLMPYMDGSPYEIEQDLQRSLYACDAILFIFGLATPDWLKSRMSEILDLVMRLPKEIPKMAILIARTHVNAGLPAMPPAVDYFYGLDSGQLRNFVATLV